MGPPTPESDNHPNICVGCLLWNYEPNNYEPCPSRKNCLELVSYKKSQVADHLQIMFQGVKFFFIFLILRD